MTIREIAIAFGFEVDKASEKNAEKAVSKLKSMATKALSAIGIGFSLVQMNKLIEEWYSVNKVLSTVNTELDSQKALQDKITEAANSCKLNYGDMCKYVTSLVKTGSGFFSTAEDAADFLKLANQSFQVAGATESQIASLNSVLTNTFNTGKLSAGGFNTICKAVPMLSIICQKVSACQSAKLRHWGCLVVLPQNSSTPRLGTVRRASAPRMTV